MRISCRSGTKVDIDDVVPNERQPRLGPKEDDELQRQIEANEGLFEPLLVEPPPDLPGKYRIIDGERRWTNSRILVVQGREQYREVPVEVTDRTLTDEQRLRVWIYIHRQRKESVGAQNGWPQSALLKADNAPTLAAIVSL